ncbi:putative beta-lactamase HcpC precursor, partial [Haemophilus influenzae]
MGVFK